MEYQLFRSDRKTISVRVDRKGNVIVRAPLWTGIQEIDRFVHSCKGWIERTLASRQPFPTLEDGSVLPLMGKSYTVAEGKPRLEGTICYLPAVKRGEAAVKLFRKIAKARMTALTEQTARQNGFVYSSVTVGSARTRWGSCNSSGKIIYTYRTIFLPDDLAEYLAVHELCHTRYLNHGKAFWNCVAAILPDFAVRRKALKDYRWAVFGDFT